jgi:hypothetical protein
MVHWLSRAPHEVADILDHAEHRHVEFVNVLRPQMSAPSTPTHRPFKKTRTHKWRGLCLAICSFTPGAEISSYFRSSGWCPFGSRSPNGSIRPLNGRPGRSATTASHAPERPVAALPILGGADDDVRVTRARHRPISVHDRWQVRAPYLVIETDAH